MSAKINRPVVLTAWDRLEVLHPEIPADEIPHPTKQEFKKECDINEIVNRWQKGISPPSWMTSATPRWGDFSDMPVSFQDAYEIMAQAEEAFMALPLAMRQELDHDPRNLDHADRDMFARYGLLKPDATTSGTPEAEEPVVQRSGDKSPGAPKGAKSKVPASGKAPVQDEE